MNREADMEPVRVEAGSVPDPVSRAAVSPPPSAPKAAAPAAPAWKKSLGILDQALELTAAQKPAIEQMLQDREMEIRSFHDGFRKAGIVDLRDFDWKANLLKASWYRKLDALLDARQHEALMPLLEKGLLNEGLAFTVEPGMTILD
jgi:hypothetical protein